MENVFNQKSHGPRDQHISGGQGKRKDLQGILRHMARDGRRRKVRDRTFEVREGK